MRRVFRRAILLTLALLVIAATTLGPAGPSLRTQAADHGDAPLTAHDLGADLNDLYLFRDPTDNARVIMIMTVHGFIVPGEASNFGIFDPALRYRFELETTGDARPDQFVDVRFSPRVRLVASLRPKPRRLIFQMASTLLIRQLTPATRQTWRPLR